MCECATNVLCRVLNEWLRWGLGDGSFNETSIALPKNELKHLEPELEHGDIVLSQQYCSIVTVVSGQLHWFLALSNRQAAIFRLFSITF